MCGIAGILEKPDRRVQAETLWQMAAILAHRGPDDRGIYQHDSLGLAQTRLAIIGLRTGHQPLRSAEGHLTLVANGEIYNDLELRPALAARGCQFQTDSDSETILQAYRVYGLDFVHHLRGMYAFALWDQREERLILARDRLGIKPLFYLEKGGRFCFASEIKALLPLLPEAPALNPRGLRQFLQNQFSTGRETPFQGIERLLPGEMLVIDRQRKRSHRRYWSLLSQKTQIRRSGEALEALDALLHSVLAEHRRSEVPFGLFLSGGLDSGTLAALLADLGSGRVQAWSVGYQGSAPDELDRAARIARALGLDYQPLRLHLESLFQRIPHSIWAADELMRDYASLPTLALAESAARQVKVVFSGEGGDEVFGGYGRYRPHPLERWFKAWLRPGSGGFRTRGQWNAHWSKRLLGPELQEVAGVEYAPFRRAWRETPPHWTDLQRRQYTDLITALPDNLLVKTDRMLMGFGLEGRVPFLDHRLVEFGLMLPDSLKVRAHQGKWLLRRWARDRLPPELRTGSKRGFHVPVGDWLRGKRLDQIGAQLLRNEGIRRWFQPEAIPALIAARHRGRKVSRLIWGLMQFAIWHRLFIEQPSRRPSPQEDPLDWIA